MANEIPVVSFDENAPQVHYGQIRDIMIGNLGYPLTAETKVVIEARIDNSGDVTTPEETLRLLTVIGDKPEPESTVLDISHKRKIKSPRKHTVNIRIDEMNEANYSFLKSLIEGGVSEVAMWYFTDGHMYGGLTGVQASINLDHVIPESTEELEYITGQLTWQGDYPARIANPLV